MAKNIKVEDTAVEKTEEIENKKNFTVITTKIYIGPTIPKYNLQENSIYVNKYPNNINEAIKEYPTIKGLMIDIKDIKNRNQENYKILYKSLKEEIGGK